MSGARPTAPARRFRACDRPSHAPPPQHFVAALLAALLIVDELGYLSFDSDAAHFVLSAGGPPLTSAAPCW